MENYKTLYEQRIERAKEEIKKCGDNKGRIRMIENIFPELAENEDERIRKGIIEYLEQSQFGEERYQIDDDIVRDYIVWLEKQGEQNIKMIQWKGDNLHEVVEFTGKSPKFNEWFKTWDDYENYVHSHGNIFKLFCEDGSHYEVPEGAWIVKTPDGYNVASKAKYKQKIEHKPAFCHHEVDFSSCSEEYRKAYYDGWNNCNQQHAQLEAEQKTIDEVKPKFKVGDYIRHKGADECYRIVTIDDNYYFCENNHAWNIKSQDYFELIEQEPEIKDDVLSRFAFYQYDDDTIYLSSLFVRESDRGRGYGSKVLKAAEEVAKTFGISKIRLKVERNTWMEEWYKKSGYEYLSSEGKYDWLENKVIDIKSDKIEQNSNGDNCKILDCDKVDMTEYNKGYECGKQRVLKYPEEFNLCEKSASAWSEEDESMLQNILECLKNGWSKLPTDILKYESWLKSLKERMKGE